MWTYRARLVKALDGDTIRVIVDLGFSIYTEMDIRLLGVFAPEMKEEGGHEAQIEAWSWLEGWMDHSVEWPLQITTQREASDEYKSVRSFTRYVGTVAIKLPGRPDLSMNDHMKAWLTARRESNGG